jgi:hypothetical protein
MQPPSSAWPDYGAVFDAAPGSFLLLSPDLILRRGALPADRSFVQKPITPDRLATAVRDVFDRMRQGSKV